MLLLLSADFFSKLTFSKNNFRNTIRVSNSLDPDQDRHSVGPDLSLFDLLRTDILSVLIWVCLFDLILYVPVNNFSVMSGHVFLG